MPFSNCGRLTRVHVSTVTSLCGLRNMQQKQRNIELPEETAEKDGLHDITVRTGLKISDSVRISDVSMYGKYRNVVTISIYRIVLNVHFSIYNQGQVMFLRVDYIIYLDSNAVTRNLARTTGVRSIS